MEVTYESTFEPSPDLIKIVAEGLNRYNESKLGKSQTIPVASFARDESGRVVGGISGWVFWDWLYIDKVWVDEAVRGRGIGSHLVLEAERMAREKGVDRSHLGTGSFQALDFYLRLGYQVVCQFDDYPKGHTNYLLWKPI